MSVLKERRFRDMRLTEEEVEARLKAYCERTQELMWKYPDGIRYAFTQTGHARAKRLLPLWRDIGLRELAGGSYDKPAPGAAQRIISVMSSRKDR